ncbi:MAG: methylated-DNA--[protein]-cysteine S-methyltransferase [Tissierellales bacterium]|nr:methylated-DNA--[protein]-cysteine S-methyltransferase [Tissierellales bacterium]MBN2828374.1 methylated-DNA--[protein]-cysteine S-methyltransferase [Tissierellales bacterium]
MRNKDVVFMDSPMGPIEVKASLKGITSISFRNQKGINEGDSPLLEQAVTELKEYFGGQRKSFDLPLDIEGTPFRMKVWNELSKIPYGETISYKELASRIGNVKASRAVGGANNKNPIGIVVPCHRVIGANGALVGYEGGIDKKKWLLDFEKENKRLEEER